MNQLKSSNTKILVIGGVLGLLSGVLAAYLLVQKSQEREEDLSISAGDGVKVGLGLLGVFKLISDLGDRN